MKKRVLLTGATGFVGAHVLKAILDNTDWETVCPISAFKNGQNRLEWAIGSRSSRVKTLVHDLTHPITEYISSEFGPIDYVINLASQSHVDVGIKKPTETIMNNVAIVCNLLDWAKTANIEKFIQCSTDEVYGPDTGSPHTEQDRHFPSNPYSASKAAQENISFSYWRTYNVPLATTNMVNVVGPLQDTEKFTPLVIKKILNNEEVTIHTSNGKVATRTYVYVENVASALLHLLSLDFNSPLTSVEPSKWHIGADGKYSNLDWAELIATFAGRDLNYKLEDGNISRPGYDDSYSLDGSKLLSSGWTPAYTLENSLEKTVNWYLENPEWL